MQRPISGMHAVIASEGRDRPMLRQPPLQAASALFTRSGASLPPPIALLRAPGSVISPGRGTRRRKGSGDAPDDARAPRGDLPYADHAPAPRAALPDGLVARCLARMSPGAPRADAIDDDSARRDPRTAPFAAVRHDAADRSPGAASRVATAADRPPTAELPVVGLD